MPLQRRLPKGGFKSLRSRVSAEVRLHELAKVQAEVIDLSVLKTAGLVGHNIRRAKVMLSGKLERAVTLKGIGATKGARAAIEAAGGKVED